MFVNPAPLPSDIASGCHPRREVGADAESV
jgi:hypothetical protein